MRRTTDPTRRPIAVAVAVGIGLLLGSFALGAALRHSEAGTSLDRWFQRTTMAAAKRPGQPGYHHRLVFLVTHITVLGGPPVVLYFALAVSLFVVLVCTPEGRRVPPKHAVWMALAPVVALAAAAASAEGLIKPVINRRMIGNLGVLTYPSVHAAGTSALASAALWVVLAGRERLGPRRGAWWLAAGAIVVVPLVVGLAMAAVRSHFLTDVIGGWAWGCGWGLLAGSLLELTAERVRRRRARPGSLMVSA